jgi:exodeoxyribonuclease V alpha subunit
VVVADGDRVLAVFGDPAKPLRVRPHRLPPVETVHAMTVHRAQGSQFGRVSLVLPPASSPLLTRELLYTALTRAREHVRIVGTEAAVRVAVERPIRRASGLRHDLPKA